MDTPPTNEPLGLRERKKQARAQAMQLAALRLVNERGLDTVTVEDIAAAANVSPRTFFNYYGSKEDALVGNMPDGADRFAAALLKRPAGEPMLDAVRAVFIANANEIAEHSELYQLRMNVVARHRELYPRMVGSFGEWERVMADAIAQRSGTDQATDIYPGLLAAVIAGIMRTSMRRWRATDFQTPLDTIFGEAFNLVRAGLKEPNSC